MINDRVILHIENAAQNGQHYCPPLIDIIDRKLNLINRLNDIGNLIPNPNREDRSIAEMIDIELKAVYDLISLDYKM